MQPINPSRHKENSPRADEPRRAEESRRTNKSRPSRAAMSGQRELHPLQLGDSAANMSANTGPSIDSARRARLTDEEMLHAATAWDLHECSARGETHTARNIHNPARFTRIEQQRQHNRFNRPVGFEIAQHDGTTAQIIQDGRAGLLLPANEGRNLRTRMQQKQISRPYFWASGLTPISAVAFGLGAFDGRMAAQTGGRILEMDRTDKWQALALLAPISLMVWVIVGVLVFLAVVAAKGEL